MDKNKEKTYESFEELFVHIFQLTESISSKELLKRETEFFYRKQLIDLNTLFFYCFLTKYFLQVKQSLRIITNVLYPLSTGKPSESESLNYILRNNLKLKFKAIVVFFESSLPAHVAYQKEFAIYKCSFIDNSTFKKEKRLLKEISAEEVNKVLSVKDQQKQSQIFKEDVFYLVTPSNDTIHNNEQFTSFRDKEGICNHLRYVYIFYPEISKTTNPFIMRRLYQTESTSYYSIANTKDCIIREYIPQFKTVVPSSLFDSLFQDKLYFNVIITIYYLTDLQLIDKSNQADTRPLPRSNESRSAFKRDITLIECMNKDSQEQKDNWTSYRQEAEQIDSEIYNSNSLDYINVAVKKIKRKLERYFNKYHNLQLILENLLMFNSSNFTIRTIEDQRKTKGNINSLLDSVYKKNQGLHLREKEKLRNTMKETKVLILEKLELSKYNFLYETSTQQLMEEIHNYYQLLLDQFKRDIKESERIMSEERTSLEVIKPFLKQKGIECFDFDVLIPMNQALLSFIRENPGPKFPITFERMKPIQTPETDNHFRTGLTVLDDSELFITLTTKAKALIKVTKTELGKIICEKMPIFNSDIAEFKQFTNDWISLLSNKYEEFYCLVDKDIEYSKMNVENAMNYCLIVIEYATRRNNAMYSTFPSTMAQNNLNSNKDTWIYNKGDTPFLDYDHSKKNK